MTSLSTGEHCSSLYRISLIDSASLIKKGYCVDRGTTKLQHSVLEFVNDFGSCITVRRTPIDPSFLPLSTHITNCVFLTSVISGVVDPARACWRELGRDEDTETCCPLLLHWSMYWLSSLYFDQALTTAEIQWYTKSRAKSLACVFEWVWRDYDERRAQNLDKSLGPRYSWAYFYNDDSIIVADQV